MATQVFNCEMAVWLEHRQSQPLEEEQDAPSQLPMQSDQVQEGSHARVEVAKRAAAKGTAAAKDFMLGCITVSRVR